MMEAGNNPSGLSGPSRSGQGQCGKEPWKMMASISLTEDAQLNKGEKAWKPSVKRSSRADEKEPEFLKTQALFRRVSSVLNNLTRQTFQPLMRQMTALTINTEECLRGVIELIFEKAISEPDSSVVYANMCRCLIGLKVPTTDNPGVTLNFRKLLLNRCQTEFKKDRNDETFEKQKELDSATGEEEKQRLKEELEDPKDKAQRRSLGNIKLIGELFKLKMLTEAIMHDCIAKLLKKQEEESLECLCCLLSTIGKELDYEKAKPRMDQYFIKMEKIIKEQKTSPRICVMLQDLLDLRRVNWNRLQPSGLSGPSRSGQGQCGKEPWKMMASVSLTEDTQLNTGEKAWKPSVKGSSRADEEEPELKTQELFRRVQTVLNELTPQTFQPLMRQMTELTINTEERLRGVIELIFEKAISEPDSSVVYANMCRCLMGLKVPTTDKPGVTLNFRKLLLNRCQTEFKKDKDDETFEKQKELDSATGEEEKQRLKEELEDAKDKAQRRSLGNIKLLGELFKLRMLKESIMHDCIVILLKNHDEESLECVCCLLSTIGKELDYEKAKPRMDQYFNQMKKIIRDRKTSPRIRVMLQDLHDLRQVNSWNRL